MLKVPIEAKKFRVRLHWANSAEELAEDVNGNLEAYPDNDIYGVNYQLAVVVGEDNKPQERHCMAVFFRPQFFLQYWQNPVVLNSSPSVLGMLGEGDGIYQVSSAEKTTVLMPQDVLTANFYLLIVVSSEKTIK